jgi:hypothetical protein
VERRVVVEIARLRRMMPRDLHGGGSVDVAEIRPRDLVVAKAVCRKCNIAGRDDDIIAADLELRVGRRQWRDRRDDGRDGYD